MFSRPELSYEVSEKVIDAILNDYAHPLSNILGLVTSGDKVLDIGAGSGMLARVLQRAKVDAIIDGIEPNIYAADLAKKHYRNLYIGLVQDFYEVIRQEKYNYIILADVIEHLPNPFGVLQELITHISKDTKLIISVPNVAFGGVRLALLNGRFDYVDSGLLERTHLRFFTKHSLEQLFRELSLITERAFSLERSFYKTEFPITSLSVPVFTLIKLAFDSEARAYQYLYLLNISNTVNQKFTLEHKGVNGFSILKDYIRGRISSFIRKLKKQYA